MENQNPRVPSLWEHSLTSLLGHDPTRDLGAALRQLVHFQGVHNILDLLSWDKEELMTIPAQQVYSLDDHDQGLNVRSNQVNQICGLITYVKNGFGAYNSGIDLQDDPFHPFTPDEWSQQSLTMLRTYLIQNLPYPHGLEPVPFGPISSSRPTGYSPAAIELMGFKKNIKREIAAYTSLKDERYFDGFKRSIFSLPACDPQRPLGLINRMKRAYPRRMLLPQMGVTQVFTLAKRSEGKMSLPLCSLTNWYYRYALTLSIAKPDPAFSWHSEQTRHLEPRFGTSIRNHPN